MRMRTDDLADLDQRGLLEQIALELRALRRLVGTVFLLGILVLLAAPIVVSLASTG